MSINVKEVRNLIKKYEKYADKLKYDTVKADLVNDFINDLYMLEEKNKKQGLQQVLDNTAETKEYLDNLKKVYMIGCWASYGVREYPFSGKYANKDKTEPLVYDYDDHNGTCDNYFLKNLYDTTTGHIWGWTWNKEEAEKIANRLEEKRRANCK